MRKHITPHAIALAAAMAAAGPAAAFEPIVVGEGFKLDARVNVTYTLGQRIKDPDALLARTPGINDGNNNFAKGALTANRASALLDTKLSYGASGIVYSGSIFYDNAYQTINDNNPGSGVAGAGFNPNGVNKQPAFNQFTAQTEYYSGGYGRTLDFYGYTAFDIGESRATVRLGRHVVNWGEALFFPSMALAQGPFDGTKTGIPGTEVKDSVLPEDQVSAAIEVTPRWTLLAHLQYGFHETLAPTPGSYLSTSDVVGQGAICLTPWTAAGCSFGVRQKDVTPDNFGQWGIGTRYRVTDETEVGLYYLNYKDRTPLPVVNIFAPGGTYAVNYFDDINLVGATYSTTLGVATVTGELTYKDNAPVLVNTLMAPGFGPPLAGVPSRGEITQLNIGTFLNAGNTPIARQTQVLAEISAIYIGEVDAIQTPGIDRFPAAIQARFPYSNARSFDTRKAVAANVTVVLGYPGIFEGWDLTVPLSYQQQFRGRTITGGVGGEGDIRYSLGATMVYGGNLSLGLTYLGYLGDADVSLRDFRPLTDRDAVSFVAKYSF